MFHLCQLLGSSLAVSYPGGVPEVIHSPPDSLLQSSGHCVLHFGWAADPPLRDCITWEIYKLSNSMFFNVWLEKYTYLRSNYLSQNYHPSIRYSQFWNISIHPVKVQFIADLFVDISSIKINIAFIGSGDIHNHCILIRWFNFDFFAACATVWKIQIMEYYYISHDMIMFLAPAWFHDPTYFPLANWLIISR